MSLAIFILMSLLWVNDARKVLILRQKSTMALTGAILTIMLWDFALTMGILSLIVNICLVLQLFAVIEDLRIDEDDEEV